MLVEDSINESFVYLPSKLALFIEENNSPSPPYNIPLPEVNSSSSPSPSPLPPSSTSPLPPLYFEQELWHNRVRSLEDARRLDIAKRILLDKIIESKPNVPNEIKQTIQDNIWGNHWYDIYRRQMHPIRHAHTVYLQDWR